MKQAKAILKNCLQNCRNSYNREMLAAAVEAGMQAGELLQELFEKPHRIRHKSAIDLVTEADLAAEEVILDTLHRLTPGIAVMSEESSGAYDAVPAEPVWIIDPLDGTTNFAHNFPWFAVSIALYAEGRSQVGLVSHPMQHELFCATLGGGAWLNDRAVRVSTTSVLEDGLVATGFPYDVRERPDTILAMLKAVLKHVQGIRRPGAAALDMAYLACARLDAFWEVGLKPWDTAAGSLLVEEAGGLLSNFSGEPFSPFVPELLASNSLLHEELRHLLHEFGTAGS